MDLFTVLTNDPVYVKKIAPGLIERATKGEVIKMCEIADALNVSCEEAEEIFEKEVLSLVTA